MSTGETRTTTQGTPTATGRLGRVVGRHAVVVALTWLLLVAGCMAAALGVVGGGLFARLGQEEPFVPSESHTAVTRIRDASTTGPTLLVRVDGVDPRAPRTATVVRQVAAAVDATAHVRSVLHPYLTPQGPAHPTAAPLLSRTAPRSVLLVAALDPDLPKAQQEETAEQVYRAASLAAGGASVSTGGQVQLLRSVTHQVEADLKTGEGIALPISLMVMVVVFGGFVAAGVPIMGAIASIGGGLACLLGFSYVMDLDATVVNIVTILGLGLSIDYGLLIVSRYREELSRIAPDAAHTDLTRDQLVEATAHTVATAGRTVAFSGLTVAISIAGMLVFPAPVIRAVSIAGVSVVAVAVVSALTLVPAMCRLGGRRIAAKGRSEGSDDGFFARLARFVQRHVWATIAATLVFLLLLAAPVLGMRQVSSTTSLMPKDNVDRVFLEGISRDFPAMTEPTASVVARTSPAEATAWAREVARMPGVTAVDPVRELGEGYVVLGVRAADAKAGNDVGADLVRHLRTNRPAFPTWVTGQDAKLTDFDSAIRDRAPWAIGAVVLATVVLLFLMTGSIALPLKALVFNVLSLGASFGAIVWIFQKGHLEGLLGFSSNGGIESIVPVILLAFAFGLSMDYEVFLLSRIVELHEEGVADADAVVVGVQRSGRIITSAALLLLIVLLGFAAAKMIIVKEIGVGLALSILLDATIVRMLLVPATMTMLGRWNWWAPGPMARWYARHGIKEH